MAWSRGLPLCLSHSSSIKCSFGFIFHLLEVWEWKASKAFSKFLNLKDSAFMDTGLKVCLDHTMSYEFFKWVAAFLTVCSVLHRISITAMQISHLLPKQDQTLELRSSSSEFWSFVGRFLQHLHCQIAVSLLRSIL